MELAIFARTFPRPTVAETLAAVAAHGLRAVQFNMVCTGLPAMPDAVPPAVVAAVRGAVAAHGVRLAALSGTFNMAHPDPAVRATGLVRLRLLAACCGPLGIGLITLSTGTRHPTDLWTGHPDNGSTAAWRDLLETMAAAVEIAARHEITLAFEPETANVASSPRRALQLLREIGSPRLAIVIDPANLFEAGEGALLPARLDEAFDLLGPEIVLAHAKDRAADGAVRPAGSGIVPWGRYLAGLRAVGYGGPLVLHGLAEGEVGAALATLRAHLAASG